MKYFLYFQKRVDKPNKFKVDKDPKKIDTDNTFHKDQSIIHTQIELVGDTIEDAKNHLHNITCQKCSTEIQEGVIFHTSADDIYKARDQVTLCKTCSMKQKTAEEL